MMTKLRGAAALLGLAAITIGLPWLLIAIGGVGVPRLGWSVQGLWQALLRPDDGTLLLSLLKLIGWLSWTILTGSIALEVIARLRRMPTPRLPGLRLPQSFARRLVGAAAALFVAGASISIATPSIADPIPTPPAAAQGAQASTHHDITHQAKGKPSEKRTTSTSSTYTVRKGDTLSEIALEHTGKASNYPRIFKASKSITQPGGHHLSDPDVIDVGWTLTIPGDTHQHGKKSDTSKAGKPSDKGATKSPKPEKPAPTPTQQTTTPASPQASPATVTPTPAASTAPSQAPSTTQVPAPQQATTSSPAGWVLTGLAGAGALLAGMLWVAVSRRRAAQFRSRRPGRTIVAPEADLAPVEKTVVREGAPIAQLVLRLDEVLRRLAAHFLAHQADLPSLVGVDAAPDALTLRFRRPVDLPAPFTAVDPQVWRVSAAADLDTVGPFSPDAAAPWPQLVTLGADATGWRLVNLEALGVVSLTGDPVYAGDLARYLVGELAVSPWARDVEIDCLAVCDELPGLAPDRIRYHRDAAVVDDVVAATVGTVDRLAAADVDNLETARAGFADDDLWDSRVLVSAIPDADHLDVLTRLVAEHPGRSATSVLLLGDQVTAVGVELRLSETGRLQVPALELDVVVNGLTESEARGCVAVLAAGQDMAEADIPAAQEADDTDDTNWTGWCNEAGSLRSDKTVPRGSDVAGTSSVLPESDEVYVETTANTAEDLAALAPQVPVTVRERVESVDPDLDADVAQWWAESSDRPRLQVLGKVKVRLGRTGQAIKAANRAGFATELVAYLHTRPRGATTADVADALGISAERVRKDASLVRGWLGINPATGEPFLPPASRAGKQRGGAGVYVVEDLLCDADLFRRLRLRGEARGADGLDDLKTALRLVHGAPYDGIRAKGGVWLADNRLDQHLLCAVVDVAHTVSTILLAGGQLDQARAAAELAALTAPDETTPQLDLAAIANREGNPEEAAAIAKAVVIGGRVGEPRADLSDRAEAILRTHRWLETRAS